MRVRVHSLGEAFLGIKAGMMDVAIAGGSESGITPLFICRVLFNEGPFFPQRCS